MIIYIYGEDNFRSREYLRESKEQFKKQRDPGGYNTVVFDGKKIELSKLVAEIKTAPFLGEKRLVIVENILSSTNKEFLSELLDKINKNEVPESTVLIFWQGEPLSKIKEAKELNEVLAKQKYSRHFEKLTGLKLTEWVEKRVANQGGKIAKNAANLVAAGAEDVWSAAATVDQLCALASGREITAADVGEFSFEKFDDNVFNLVDAVAAGNHKKALTLLEGQRQLGEEDGKLFGIILWQFRTMLQIADLLDRESGITSEALAKKLNINPFVAKKNLAVVKQYSLSRLENIYSQLLETDLKTKTGRGSQSLLLDLFVIKV